MDALSCFIPDLSAPVGELVIHVVHFTKYVEVWKPVLAEDTIVLHANHNSSAEDVIQSIRGKFDIPFEIELVFCGKLLAPADLLQIDYFESFTVLDDVSTMFRPRLSMVVLLHMPTQSASRGIKIIEDDSLADEMREKELQQRREQELYEQQLIDQSDVSVQVSKFDLYYQLEQIECLSFFEALNGAGFNQEGTFALLSEDDFEILRISVPERAKRRLLELSRTLQDSLLQQRVSTAHNHEKPVTKKARRAAKDTSHESNVNKLTALEEKIQGIRQRLSKTSESSTERPETRLQVCAPCCEVHQDKVTDRKTSLKLLNKVKFTAEISSRLEWLDSNITYGNGVTSAFAPLQDMLNVAWYVIQQWGGKDFDKSHMHSELERLAQLTVIDLHQIETVYEVHHDITQYSLINGYLYSKRKFVDSLVVYVETVNPLFFITNQ